METRVSNIHIKYKCRNEGCGEKGSVSLCNIVLFLASLGGITRRKCSVCRDAVEITFVKFRYIKGDRYVENNLIDVPKSVSGV